MTASSPGTFLVADQPYGAGRIGQAGLEVKLKHDTRDTPSNPLHGFFMQVAGATHPRLWSARSAFHRVSATASTYVPIPVRKHAVLALRAGGEKVFGDFPFYEAAFLGGARNLRAVRHQRFAGDVGRGCCRRALGVPAAWIVWLAYTVIDLAILLVAGMSIGVGLLFVVSFATKLAAGHGVATLRIARSAEPRTADGGGV